MKRKIVQQNISFSALPNTYYVLRRTNSVDESLWSEDEFLNY